MCYIFRRDKSFRCKYVFGIPDMEHYHFSYKVVTQVLFDEKISQVLFGKDARLFAKELLQFTA